MQLSPGTSLPIAMAETAKRHPDRVAIAARDGAMTFAELETRAAALAAHLTKIGVGRGDLVGVAMERSLELMVGLVATWKAGAAYVPLDPDYPEDRVAFMVDDADAAAILTQTRLSSTWGKRPVVHVDAFDGSTPANLPSTAGSDLAYVIYTSGSTGRPKGAILDHAAIANRIAWMQKAFPLGEDDVVLQKTPTSFDVSVWELFWSLSVGAKLYLADPGGHRDDVYLAETIVREGVTTCHFVPSMLAVFLEAPNIEACSDSLRRIVCSGEALPVRLVRRFRERLPGVELHNLYGPTEAAVDVTHWPVDFDASEIPIGRAIDGVSLYVVDPETLDRVPDGEDGELWIGGVQVGRGYLNRPELTAERFLDAPFASPGGRVYRTGDRVRRLPSGDLLFLGRFDHQVKIRGVRIELGEIEARLAQHVGVREATVVARDEGDGAQLIAYVVPQAPPEAPPKSVQVWSEVFDATYDDQGEDGFDIAGWNSSYTGAAIPSEQMRRWRDATLERLRSLQPRRVLELGCGTGMLLFGLAESLERYVGLDLSPKAIADLERRVAKRGWDHVELHAAAAHEVADFADDEFDLVIVNSVLQFFPGPRYLRSIVEEGRRVTRTGGHLFFGDVRSLPHLDAFHASVQRARASDQAPSVVHTRTLEAIASEEELLVDPLFFRASGEGFGGVEILWRRGRDDNEMVRWRYDAILHIGPSDRPRPPPCEPWPGLEALASLAGDHHQLGPIPNARVAVGIDPEDVVATGEDAGFHTRIAPAMDAPESMIALLDRWVPSLPESLPRLSDAREASTTNAPGRGLAARTLRRRWRQWLGETLPDAMVPSALVLLPKMPLTPSGKVDRKALPPPDRTRRDAPMVSARSEVERVLTGVWQRVLGLSEVGVHDNFFDLGGDSILALRIAAEARDAGIELTPAVLLRHHTVAELAAMVGELTIAPAEQGRIGGKHLLTAMQRWTLAHAPVAPNRSAMVTRLRLRRPIEPAHLRQAAEAVVTHHDALRLTFVDDTARYGDSVGLEVVVGKGPFDEGLALSEGPVGRLWLDGDRLTIALHHMVADGISVRLLLEDLERAVNAIEAGELPAFPCKSTSFQQAAARLANRPIDDEERRYWREVAESTGTSLSEGASEPEPDLERDEAAIERALDAATTERLLRVAPQTLGATLDDLLLASVAWGLAQWTGGERFVVDTESHGREALDDLDLSRTVGVFSALFPVCLQTGSDVFRTLRAVARERAAIPAKGVGFGILRWVEEDAVLTSAPKREVLFNFLGRYDHVVGEDSRFAIVTEGGIAARAPEEPRPHAVLVEARVVAARLHIRWAYAGKRFSEADVAGAADAMLDALRELTRPTGKSAARFELCSLDDASFASVAGDADIVDAYPIAPLQEGMLLHSLLEPGSGVYRVQISGVVDDCDEARLRDAWQGLIAAHPILRTRFVPDHRMQLVHAASEPHFAFEDWRGRDARVEQWQRERGDYAMTDAGLTSLQAAHTDEGMRIFWSFHHALLDGWSMVDLLEELLTRIQEPSLAPPKRPPYRDYVRWALRRRENTETEETFRRLLRGVKHATHLPTDGPHDVPGTDTHAKHTFALDAAALQSLARRERVTLNTVVQSAWALALAHWSGARDVVFGAVVPGRPASLRGADRIVGLLMNTLPVRARIPDAPLGEWLGAQGETMAELLEHEHMPLADAQKLASLPPGAPLLSTVISVQGYLRGAATLEAWAEGLGLRQLSFIDWNDLPLSAAIEAGDALQVTLKHDRRLLSAQAAARIADDVQCVLRVLPKAQRSVDVLAELEAAARERRKVGAAARSGPRRRRGKTMGEGTPKSGPKRARRRRALPSDPRDWVQVGTLPDATHAVPAVITPTVPVDLATWAGEQREHVEALLREHRALLFRGFGVGDPKSFAAVVAATSDGDPLEYRDRTTPRTTKATGVYTSTVHPADQTIRLHNEGTYWRRWAKKLYFACAIAAREGGATPIADVRRVYERIDPTIRTEFESRGMMLVRNYNDGFGLPWQEVFQTDDRAEVERYCRDNDIELEWKDRGRMRTRSIRPAIRCHPRTGEKVWFNHVAFFHWTSMEASIRDALLTELGEDGLPYNTFYGDGGAIDGETIASIRRAYEAEKVAFPWEAGDVMLLDNMAVAHGRQPYEGDREVLVAMTEPVGDDDLPPLEESS